LRAWLAGRKVKYLPRPFLHQTSRVLLQNNPGGLLILPVDLPYFRFPFFSSSE
jgi:hypothetical protein